MTGRRAEPVLLLGRPARALEEALQRARQRQAHTGHELERDRVVGEDRPRWIVAQSRRRAMHVEMIRSGRDRALLEHDLIGLDALDVAEPDDVLDAAELLELPRRSPSRPSSWSARRFGRCGASPRRLRGVRTPPPPTPTRPSPRAGRTMPAKVRGCPGWKNARLRIQVSRGRIHVMSSGSRPAIEQPADRVQRGLAAADDHVPGGRMRERGQLADRDAADPVGHLERRRIGRRHARRHVGRVDDAAANRHVRHPIGHPGAEAPRRPGSRTSGRTGPAPTPGTGDA